MTGLRYGTTHLVESNGEPLLVRKIFKLEKNLRAIIMIGFQMFKADLSRKMWVGLESLGERVLILHDRYSVSLLAADVGAKGNCIYFTTNIKSDNEDG